MNKTQINEKADFLIKKSKKSGADNVDVVYIENTNIDVGCRLRKIERLEKKHDIHMKYYGSGNEERMTGEHETASFNKFTYDVANRGCSIRIGNDTHKNEKGYFEDRRPSSNCDPYLVTGMIFKTTVLVDN